MILYSCRKEVEDVIGKIKKLKIKKLEVEINFLIFKIKIYFK
nr:MAG TPA: hypothetical protein [Caudoviricetes sp.]